MYTYSLVLKQFFINLKILTMARIKCEWFVEPLDADTNKVVGRLLLDGGSLEENIFNSIETKDGRKIRVFRLRDYSDVAYLRRSRLSLNLRFKIYNRLSAGKLLQEWLFLDKKKKTAKAKVKKVAVEAKH